MWEKVLEHGETLLGYLEGGLQKGASDGAGEDARKSPIVFLHGVGRAGSDFLPLFASLADQRRLYALDARGHGRSGRVPGFYKIRDHARDALSLLKHLEKPAVLYGHSMGALVSIVAASARPDLVAGIVLEDPPGPEFLATLKNRPYYKMFQAMAALAGSSQKVPDLARQIADIPISRTASGDTVTLGQVRDAASIRLGARYLRDVDPEVYGPLLETEWLEGVDFTGALQGLSCPVLLMVGEEKAGGMLSEREAGVMTAAIPDCLSVPFPGVGHLIHWTATQSCLAAVQSFLIAIDQS